MGKLRHRSQSIHNVYKKIHMGHMVIATNPVPHWLRCNPLILPEARVSGRQTSLDAQVLGRVGWGGLRLAAALCSIWGL